mgnify:CR=1 FL=1
MLTLVPRLHRATHQVGAFIARQQSGALSQAEAHVLSHLAAARGTSTLLELHRSFGTRRSTLTSVLDRLEARGLLRRDTNPDDRRSVLLRLTPAGRAPADAMHAALATLERRTLAAIKQRDLAGFLAVLSALEGAAAEEA